MRSLKYKISALLVFLLLFWCAFSYYDERDVSAPPDGSTTKVAEFSGADEFKGVSGMSGPKNVNSSQENNSDPGISVDAMIHRFNSDGSYRAFYESALKNPGKGGVYYALRILNICSAVKNSTIFGGENQTPYSSDMEAGMYGKISEAAESLRAKCSMFTPEELSQKHIVEIGKSNVSLEDPLIAAGKVLGSIGAYDDVGRRKKLIDDVIKIGDPLLISDLGMRLALFLHPGTGQLMFKFGGEDYPLDSNVDVGFALYMLPCSLGLQCDKNEFDMALKCASNTGCYEGRIDYVREMMTAASRDFDGTMKLYEQMADAVKKGDLTKFLN